MTALSLDTARIARLAAAHRCARGVEPTRRRSRIQYVNAISAFRPAPARSTLGPSWPSSPYSFRSHAAHREGSRGAAHRCRSRVAMRPWRTAQSLSAHCLPDSVSFCVCCVSVCCQLAVSSVPPPASPLVMAATQHVQLHENAVYGLEGVNNELVRDSRAEGWHRVLCMPRPRVRPEPALGCADHTGRRGPRASGSLAGTAASAVRMHRASSAGFDRSIHQDHRAPAELPRGICVTVLPRQPKRFFCKGCGAGVNANANQVFASVRAEESEIPEFDRQQRTRLVTRLALKYAHSRHPCLSGPWP